MTTQSNELIALVDMDGTIADYDGAIRRDLAKLAGPTEEPYVSSGPDAVRPSHIDARTKLIRKTPGWWRELEAIPQGIMMLNTMRDLGFEIHILTKGPSSSPNAWSEKVEWCRKNLASDVSITITEDKGLVYGAVLMDDWPPYITRWLEWRARGFVIMPAQPWNENFSHPNVLRYSGTEEERRLLTFRLKTIVENRRQKVYP